jgi:hypothetical protein
MRTLLAAVLVSALMASGARGQIIDPDKAQAWLENTYGIKSERVAEATADELVALRTIEPRPPSDFHVIAHFETFMPPDPLTPPSSDREYLINCPSRRFHVDRIESFSEHGARGGQSTSFGPTVWGLAIPNSPDERIISAVCGPSAAEVAIEAARSLGRGPEVPPPPPQPAPSPAPKVAVQSPAARGPRPATAARKPPPGAARVQLYASPDRAAAQQAMAALPARLPAAAVVGRPEIVEGSSGGKPIYRVQLAGFASTADAARFCAAARAAGQDCFVPPAAGR